MISPATSPASAQNAEPACQVRRPRPPRNERDRAGARQPPALFTQTSSLITSFPHLLRMRHARFPHAAPLAPEYNFDMRQRIELQTATAERLIASRGFQT